MLSLVLISAVYKLGWRNKNRRILELGSDSGCLHSVVGEQLISKCGGLSLSLGASCAFRHDESTCWWGKAQSLQKYGLVINNLGTVEWLGSWESLTDVLSPSNEVIWERNQKFFRSIMSSLSSGDLF